MIRRVTSVVAALLVSGCTLAPPYSVPASEQPSTFKEAGAWMPATQVDVQPRVEWWRDFGDPQLDELESRLQSGNLDLRAALSRYDQARAEAQLARAQALPALGADASAQRGRGSANSPLGAALGGKPSTQNDLLGTLNFAWEIDLFGRLRSAAAAARAQAQASAADLALVRLSLQAQLASDYLQLRGADSQDVLLSSTVNAYERSTELTRHRHEEGIAAATDVDQADAQYQNALSLRAANQLLRARLEHAIAVMVGENPSRFVLQPLPLAAAAPTLPGTGLPSALLLQRPDVARAERQLAAANANVGVARAAWFPVFRLTGVAGYESTRTPTWCQAPSRLWSVGPSMSVPLLDAGSRRAVTRQARAAYDEALANYRKATLVAYQEVEDALAALRLQGEQQRASEAAAAASDRAAFHADRRYDAGIADYLEVTSTHTLALQAHRAAIDARVAQLSSAVDLIRATGGGWTRETTGGPVPP